MPPYCLFLSSALHGGSISLNPQEKWKIREIKSFPHSHISREWKSENLIWVIMTLKIMSFILPFVHSFPILLC